MVLAENVSVAGRFRRSVRIDTDLRDPSALDGFVCPRSSAIVLEEMGHHIEATGHSAFTWTGPYGSGKSSLALALAAMLSGGYEARSKATEAIDPRTTAIVWNALPPMENGWRILPVVGRREPPQQVLGEALVEEGFISGTKRRKSWTSRQVISALLRVANEQPRASGGLLVIIDEMGKFLEGAVYEGSDIHFLQELAELASRSDRRLILVGILHQAFEEYGYRLGRETQDEWSKIQGRFIDLAVNVAAEEQITLISRAIESKHSPMQASRLARYVAEHTNGTKSEDLPQLLEQCWPLHPVVASLLGPISRRRFGQNQRSVFGFLNSAEPSGFQDFLSNATKEETYLPHDLWDYLRINLEPSIMSSPDGHRWAMAVEALDRCVAVGGQDIHVRLLSTIATLDLFKERSGLLPAQGLLERCLPFARRSEVRDALKDLESWSLIVYRRLTSSYSIFEGSDFDIDGAVTQNLQRIPDLDIDRLSSLADLQPIVAKRHYHETGSLRWFSVVALPASDAMDYLAQFSPQNGSIGLFALLVPTRGESKDEVRAIAQESVASERTWDIAIGEPQSDWGISAEIRELLAIEDVQAASPALQGDAVARREVEARVSLLRDVVESSLTRAFEDAMWHIPGGIPTQLSHAGLSVLASDLASAKFEASPILPNELLNRIKPSGNAVAARNTLLKHMALNEGQERLGIKDYPAEGGLCDTLLVKPGLYRETDEGWRFIPPAKDNDPRRMRQAWQAAREFLIEHRERSVSADEIFGIWREAPYGIRDGLLPVLVSAFVLSYRRELAFYRDRIFQAKISDVDMEVLAHNPRDIQLRWMSLSEEASLLLSDMASVVRDLDPNNPLSNLEPIDVARGLVSIHDGLHPWVGRTQLLSENAKRVRQLFKQAIDPNRLIFDDIPETLADQGGTLTQEGRGDITGKVRDGLTELAQAYPAMLHKLTSSLLGDLQVPNDSSSSLTELRLRAKNVTQLAGDHRMEAFVLRVSRFQGTHQDIESLASMAANKPLQNWVDTDVERATTELGGMAQGFLRLESLAHVKGRRNRRHAMAVTVGLSGRPTTAQQEFAVTAAETDRVEELVEKIINMVQESGVDQDNVILAALAEYAGRLMEDANEGSIL